MHRDEHILDTGIATVDSINLNLVIDSGNYSNHLLYAVLNGLLGAVVFILKEHFDQDLHCLPFCLHLLHTFFMV